MSKPGPKPRYGDTAVERVWLRVTPAQRRKIEAVAAMNLTTVQDLLREAVDSYAADCSDETVFTQEPMRS